MPIRAENRDRYPADWDLRSRLIRFFRADNKCEWCGARNYEPHPITGSIFNHTATTHIYTPEHCTADNLRALCQKCHLTYDAPEKARRRRERLGQQALGI